MRSSIPKKTAPKVWRAEEEEVMIRESNRFTTELPDFLKRLTEHLVSVMSQGELSL